MRRVRFEDDDDVAHERGVEQLLRGLRGVLVKHPVAAQALFSALVREGRAFAETGEGAALRDLLARSGDVARLRDVWSIGTMNVLREHADGPMPSAFIEAIAAAAARFDETWLSRIFESTDDVF